LGRLVPVETGKFYLAGKLYGMMRNVGDHGRLRTLL
jgi:hypothetical protein